MKSKITYLYIACNYFTITILMMLPYGITLNTLANNKIIVLVM